MNIENQEIIIEDLKDEHQKVLNEWEEVVRNRIKLRENELLDLYDQLLERETEQLIKKGR